MNQDGAVNGNYLEVSGLVKYFGDDRAVDGCGPQKVDLAQIERFKELAS